MRDDNSGSTSLPSSAELPPVIRAHQPLGRTLLRLAHRVAGVNAHIAQRVEAAPGLSGHEDGAPGGIAAKPTAILGKARLVVERHHRPLKDPLTLGGKYLGVGKQRRIGHDFAVSAELFSEVRNTDR